MHFTGHAGRWSRTRAYERKTGSIIPWIFHYRGRRLQSIRKAWATALRAAALEEGVGKLATRHRHDQSAIRAARTVLPLDEVREA